MTSTGEQLGDQNKSKSTEFRQQFWFNFQGRGKLIDSLPCPPLPGVMTSEPAGRNLTVCPSESQPACHRVAKLKMTEAGVFCTESSSMGRMTCQVMSGDVR